MPVSLYTTLDDPLASQGSLAFGINAAGQIVGYYFDNSHAHGFLRSGGIYTTLDDPLAANTFAMGINDAGQIVGDGSRQDRSAAPAAAHSGFPPNDIQLRRCGPRCNRHH